MSTTFDFPQWIDAMLGGSLVTTACCILRLRMEGSPPDTRANWEYIE